jgi:hypothetical protein
MKLKLLAYQLITIALILTVTLGCNLLSSPSLVPQPNASETKEPESGGSFQLKVPATLDPKPESAAAALLDPSRIEEGVWFLLRGLGIGVYTGDGQQVLAGSETGPQDFWIYDFEVPLLVRLAQEPSRPFSEFLPLLTEFGWKSGLEQTLIQYKEGYAANPNAYLGHLFAATGLIFEGDPQITPLQEWLLLLDTFIPPNPITNAWTHTPPRVILAATGILPLMERTVFGSGMFPSPEQQPCGSIRGGSFIPNWGVANGFLATANDLIEMGNAYYAIHGPLLAKSVKAELVPSKWEAHEGHGAPGDSITFTLTLRIDYGGLNMTIMPPTCGLLVNNIINMDTALVSPLRDVQVWWEVSLFTDHGSFKERGRPFDPNSPTQTDPYGQTAITFQARQEPADGHGELKSIKANIRANYDPRYAIQMLGVTEPRLLKFLVGLIYVDLPGNITIEWHAQPSFTVDGVYWGAYHLTGTICALDQPFTLKAEQSLGGEPGVGEFVFTPSSASGGAWKYDGTMCGQGICLTVNGSSTYQLDSRGADVPTFQVDPGSNWTVTAPLVGTIPLGEGNHLGVVETIILTPLDPNECSQP